MKKDTAVAHHAMVPLTSPYLLFNADGTSSQTEGGLTDLVKVKYLPYDWEARNVRPLKVAAQKDGQLVSFFIKYYMFVNAVGDIGAPIYIIADFHGGEYYRCSRSEGNGDLH